MGIVVSGVRAVEWQLQNRGFERRPWVRGAAVGARVWVRNNTHVVSVQSIEIDPPFDPAAVEDYFRKLRSVLEGILNRGTLPRLFLPGGGSIPVPEEFLDWCRQNGIEVRVVEPGERIEDLPDWPDSITRRESKRDRARRVYSENSHLSRKEIIRKFIDECGLTEKGASTYYQDLKRTEHMTNVDRFLRECVLYFGSELDQTLVGQ